MILPLLILCVVTTIAKTTEQRSYYDELEVKQTATLKEIKKAYFKLARTHHPDKVENYDEAAQAKFEAISRSYEILSEPKTRERYDKLLAIGKFEYKDEDFAATDRAEAEEAKRQKAERKKKKDPKKMYEEALLREEELARSERNQLLVLGAMGTAILGLIVWFVVGKLKHSSFYKNSQKEKEEKVTMQKISENHAKKQQLEKERLEQQELEWLEQEKYLEKRLEEVEKEYEQIDESKITQTEQANIEVIDDLIAVHEEEQRAKKAKQTNFYCAACKKAFKSAPQWDNHIITNKHKSTVKGLKGNAKTQFEESFLQMSKLREKQTTKKKEESSDEEDEEI